MSNSDFIRRSVAVLAIFLGIAWGVAVVIGIAYSIKGSDDPAWVTGDGMKYFMPGITALIGGVVAVAFGADPKANGGSDRIARLASLLEAKTFYDDAARDGVARLYFLLYLTLGLCASVVWIVQQSETIEYVRTLAPAWGGLVIPVVAAWISPAASS